MEMNKILEITTQLLEDLKEVVDQLLLEADEKDDKEVSAAVLSATTYLSILTLQAAGVSRQDAKDSFLRAIDIQYEELSQ